MQQYYLHNQFINNGLRKNIKSVKINHQNLVCMSNDNVLEFYEYTQNGIRYKAKYSLNCSIAKIEILPTKQSHKSDYLFIVDQKGIYGFWHNQTGLRQVQKPIISNKGSLYTNQEDPAGVLFSGQLHHFDVFDTKGSIFFSISNNIVFIEYTINRVGIRIEKTRKISLPYIKYRYLNWIKCTKKGKLFGIIEQIEERTILKVHNLQQHSFKINEENLVFKQQKLNLFEFASQNDNLLMLSDDEISGISVSKNYQSIYTHKIHNANGKIICLNQETYCYISEELLVFNKAYIKSFGSFKQDGVNLFEKKGILEISFLRQMDNEGYMISINTLNNEVYFVVLYQNAWKLYYHLKSLTSIYSIHSTPNTNSLIVVMDQSIDQYQIVLVEKQNFVPLIKEQKCEVCIDKLISINQGSHIIAGSQQSSFLMKYNEEKMQFDVVSQLPQQNILLLSGNIMLSDSALYTISLQNSFCEELARQDIVLCTSNQERVIYMDARGSVKMINLEITDISVLRNDAFDEYVWHLMKNNDLIVGKASNVLKLYIHHSTQETISQVNLSIECLISSIHHFTYENESFVEEMIAVGYMNGSICLYSLGGEQKSKFINYCQEPVSFFSINSSYLGIISGSKQFIMCRKNNVFTIRPIQLSKNQNKMISVAFLQTSNQFIFVQSDSSESGKLIRMVSLHDIQDGLNTSTNNHDSYRIKTINEDLNEIPVVFIYADFILVGFSSNLNVYQLLTGRLVKTLPHYLKDVIGIMVLECGIVVYGIDSIERNLLYVYSFADLEEVCTINFILKDNKYIKALKAIPNSNRFLCRGESFTAICQLNFPKQISQITDFKTDLRGYSLEIDQEHSLLGETDSKRLLLIFSFAENIIPIARYVSSSQINDFLILHRCVLIGDKSGFLHLLEFNTEDPNEALRMGMSKVASINVGEEVTTLSKRNDTQALYGTVSGRIGIIQIINEDGFRLLKPAEEASFKACSGQGNFQYSRWRGRQTTEDKLVDGLLVKQYLQQNSKRILKQEERASFAETEVLFSRLMI